MPHRTHWISSKLEDLRSQSLFRGSRIRQSPHVGGMVQLDGTAYVDFSSNDYLGLAAHPAVVEGAASVLGQIGLGSGASPLVSGRGIWHDRLERALARFEDAEGAILFPSGFAANLAVLSSLAGTGDVIYSDALNHASIIDGCRLSRATVLVYRHGDVAHLEELLKKRTSFRRALVVTESLFSMDGDLAPLGEIAVLAETNDTMMVVDEAHATGVLGELGRGGCELTGIDSRVTVKVGTLSKALGAIGGFAVGSKMMIDWLRNHGRSYVFSTAFPETICGGVLAALTTLESNPQLKRDLLEKASWLRNQLNAAGISTGNSQSPIIPVILGDADLAIDVSQSLARNGLLVPAIRPPTVPMGTSRLRISLTTGHTTEHLERLIVALKASLGNRP